MAAPPSSERPRPRRIGLYGGSFDPVHRGHLHAARAARDLFELDRVVFVPAAQSPHKLGRRTADAHHRVAMLRLAIAGEPRFEVDELELGRPGPSYTIDTVRALPAHLREPAACEIYLVVGSDNLRGLATWRSARELLERVQPIVVHRDGEPELLLAEIERELGPEAAAKVARGYLRLPPVEVSSTEVRAECGAESALDDDVPPAVLAYIRAHGLYGASA